MLHRPCFKCGALALPTGELCFAHASDEERADYASAYDESTYEQERLADLDSYWNTDYVIPKGYEPTVEEVNEVAREFDLGSPSFFCERCQHGSGRHSDECLTLREE